MSLRQFERSVRVKSEVLKEYEEAEWMRLATLVSHVHSLFTEKGKMPKQPMAFFNEWLGKEPVVQSVEDRMKKYEGFLKRHHERREREKAKAL